MNAETMYKRITLSAECGLAFGWDKWQKEIPALSFPSNWLVTITPPFGGAIVRFLVADKNNSDKRISVYLDCYNSLGYHGEPGDPYWEIFPYEEDIWRCAMHETDELIEHIELGLRKLIMPRDDE